MEYRIQAKEKGAVTWSLVAQVSGTLLRVVDKRDVSVGAALLTHVPDCIPENWPRTFTGSDRSYWKCTHTREREAIADAARFLWRNGYGMWNACTPDHLQSFLCTSTSARIRDDAEGLQVDLASRTADRLRELLVGVVISA